MVFLVRYSIGLALPFYSGKREFVLEAGNESPKSRLACAGSRVLLSSILSQDSCRVEDVCGLSALIE